MRWLSRAAAAEHRRSRALASCLAPEHRHRTFAPAVSSLLAADQRPSLALTTPAPIDRRHRPAKASRPA